MPAERSGEDIAKAGSVNAWRNPVKGRVRLIRTSLAETTLQSLKMENTGWSE